MKIFTLLAKILKFLTGKSSRLIAFYAGNTGTPVQKNKPVFMKNFFTSIKKLFKLTDNRDALLDNLNGGCKPGCCSTAGVEIFSRTNQNHDVAQPAASFAFIPTAMNHSDKKSFVKTITGRSGIFGFIMLMSSLFFVSTALGQTTTLFLQN